MLYLFLRLVIFLIVLQKIFLEEHLIRHRVNRYELKKFRNLAIKVNKAIRVKEAAERKNNNSHSKIQPIKLDIHVSLIICNRTDHAITLIKTILLFTKARVHFHLVREKELEVELLNAVGRYMSVRRKHKYICIYCLGDRHCDVSKT